MIWKWNYNEHFLSVRKLIILDILFYFSLLILLSHGHRFAWLPIELQWKSSNHRIISWKDGAKWSLNYPFDSNLLGDTEYLFHLFHLFSMSCHSVADLPMWKWIKETQLKIFILILIHHVVYSPCTWFVEITLVACALNKKMLSWSMLISGLNGMMNQRMFQSKILSQLKRKHSWNRMTINVVFPSLCPFKLYPTAYKCGKTEDAWK